MYRDSLAYELFSAVCMTLLGIAFLVYNVADLPNPWRIGVGVFVLIGGLDNSFNAYRRLRRRAAQR